MRARLTAQSLTKSAKAYFKPLALILSSIRNWGFDRRVFTLLIALIKEHLYITSNLKKCKIGNLSI
jgi:hypothetical protein